MTQHTSQSQKTALVLGAKGSVGKAVAKAFLAHGWRVLGLVRPGKEAQLPTGVIAVTADLYKPAAVAKACGPVDVVFDGLNLPYSDWAKGARPLYQAALDIAEALQARHIFPGNVYNFGGHMPPELWADTPYRPTTRKGKIRVDIEALLRQSAEAGRVRTLIVRAGDFFGAEGSTSWMDLLVGKELAKGKLTAPGRRDLVHAWACLPDLAEVIVRLAEIESTVPAFEVFHFEGHNVTLNEVAKAGEIATGRRVRISGMPRFVFSLLALFDKQIKEALEMLYLWDTPHAVKDDRLSTFIGPVPRTPLAEALKSLL